MASTYGFGEPVSCNNCICWSEDNRIAVSTDKSIRVFRLVSSVTNIEPRLIFHQSFISSEEDVLDIPKFSDRNNLFLLRQLPKLVQNAFIMDKVMNPFNFSQNTLPLTGYCAAQWSPNGLTLNRKCVLAALSHDFRLTLHAQVGVFKWEKLCDLSMLRLQKTRPEECMITVATYAKYRDWCYVQAVVAIAWCPQLYTDTESNRQFALLATGTKSGTVVIWKIYAPVESGSDCSIYTSCTPHTGYVTQLTWSSFSGTLAVGYVDGQLHAVKVDPVDPEATVIHPVITDTDLLRISCMKFVSDSKTGEDVLLATKEDYVFGFLLDSQQRIVSKTHVLGESTLHATGMCLLTENSVIVSSLDGVLQKIHWTLEKGELRLSVSSTNVDMPPVFDRASLCQGIAMSPNRVFLTFIQRPVPGYDTLESMYRMSAHLHFRSVTELGVDGDTEKLTDQKFNICNDFTARKLDIVELYRQNLIQHRLSDWTSIRPRPSSTDKNTLMAYMFNLFLQDNYIKSKVDAQRENTNHSELLERLKKDLGVVLLQVQARHIQQLVQKLKQVDIHKNKIKNLKVMTDMATYLRQNKDTMKPMNFGGIEEELTDLIGEDDVDIKTECCICSCSLAQDRRQMKCENGHVFEMCCHTLQPCEGIDYRKCSVCGSVSLTPEQLKEYDWLEDWLDICGLCEGAMY